MDHDELLRVLRAFEREGLEYVLIGATAMGLHGLVRATEDVDVFVSPTPANVELLKRASRAAYGDDPSIEEIRAEDLVREPKDLEGIRVRVATPRALYDLKKGTLRAIDRQDAAALKQRFGLEDR